MNEKMKDMKKIFSIVCMVLFVSMTANAQLSQNPDKFLGNTTTTFQVDVQGLEQYYKMWNQITCANESMWGSVEYTKGTYIWSNCNKAYNYAVQHNFPFTFHALVCGSQYPNWFSNLSATERYQSIVKWMDAVKKQYPNLDMITVVNEGVGMHQQGNSLMKESLGGEGETGYDWIINAFEMAYERWPNAILIFNDYNTFAYDTDNYLDLVKTLRDAGAPIDAYGCEAHEVTSISVTNLKNAMNKLQNGLKMPMYITEMDIDIEDDEKQKAQYENILPIMWEADYCAGVTLWGYVHGSTWVDNSGLIKNGTDRLAMSWLREYMQSNAAINAKSPFPGMKKEASVYIKPASTAATQGEPLPITIRAKMRTKTIDHIDFYAKGQLYKTLTEAPYELEYTPTTIGQHDLKAVVYATDGSTYEREASIDVAGGSSNVNVVNLINNGDMEGSDVSSFFEKINAGDILPATITNGVGVNGTRGIKVAATAMKSDAWENQFWFRLNHPVSEGTKFRLSYDYRADTYAHVATEFHEEPGSFISMTILGGVYNMDRYFSEEWQHFSFEGTMDAANSSDQLPMRSMAFSLNYFENANNYYFDNIQFDVYLEDQCPKPTFIKKNNQLTIDSPFDATIYYTTNGSTPTTSSTKYSSPLSLPKDCTVKAIAVVEGYEKSDVASYDYEVGSPVCQAPTITRNGTSNVLTMSCATSGAKIYYTTDGTEPNEESALYEGPITITFNCTVSAIAVHDEMQPSEITKFTVDWLSVYGVTVDYKDGLLTLSCSTPNSQIRYEIGGKEVTENSTLYTTPITLTDNRVVKYKAFASGLDPVGGSFTPNNFTCAEVTLKSYDGLNFELTTTEADAAIYYTTDGSAPTTSSEVFLGKTPLTGLCTINAMVVKPYKNNSKVLTLPITYFFNGMTVYLAEAGHVEDALQWRGTDGLEELTIECQGKGAVNATDMTYLRTMKGLKHLNMVNARFENNTAPTGAFSGMNIVSVEMPAKNITTMGNVFSGCNHLAAIVWNAQVMMASTASAVGITNPNLFLYVKNKVYAPQGVQNIVIDGKADDIVLSDEGSFYCPQSFTAQSISYTHKFSQTTGIDECRGWETIALPFDVQTINHERLGAISPFTATNGSVRKFWLCTLSDEGFIWADAIKANTPYLISMPNNEAYATPYILAGNIIFGAENVTIPVTNLKTSRRGTHVFTPCFDAHEASEMVYVINKNDQSDSYAEGSVFLPNYRDVKPFEAYIAVPTNGVAPRYIPIRDESDTGIMELQNDGIMKLQNGTYDMTGRKVQGELKRGVYIVNGKKVMVK